MATRSKGRRGQAATEYVIIVGLVAMLLVAVLARFKDSLANVLGRSRDRVDVIARNMNGSGTGGGGVPGAAPGGGGGGGGGGGSGSGGNVGDPRLGAPQPPARPAGSAGGG